MRRFCIACSLIALGTTVKVKGEGRGGVRGQGRGGEGGGGEKEEGRGRG